MFKRRFHVFCNEAGAGDGGAAAGSAAGADAGAAGSAGASAGGDNGAASGGSADTGSALAAGAAAAAGAGAGAGKGGEAADPYAWIATKYRVTKDDGSIDVEASARKVADAHSHLEKRFGAGDVPPKSAADYKVNVPDALADKISAEDLSKSEDFKGMLEKAHAKGLSQDQVDFMVGEFLDRSIKLQQAVPALQAQECIAELKSVWADKADYDKNIGQAFQALKHYAGDKFDAMMAKFQNDPQAIQLLAAVGRDMGEDTGIPRDVQQVSEADAESLAKSEAYWNVNHPDHAKTKEKVTQFYATRFGSKPKSSGSIGFGSL